MSSDWKWPFLKFYIFSRYVNGRCAWLGCKGYEVFCILIDPQNTDQCSKQNSTQGRSDNQSQTKQHNFVSLLHASKK